jgi:hypothetical protein
MVHLESWEDEDDDIIDESPEYSPKSEYSKARIVYDSTARIMELRAKEMKAGYWNMEVKNGFPVKTWIPDSRKAFISAVNALRSLLAPEISRDNKFKDVEKELQKEMEELHDTYVYEEKKLIMRDDKKTIGGVPVWIKTGVSYMPEIGSNVTIADLQQPQLAQTLSGGWDDKTNAYYDQLVLVYDEYFAELNFVIDRLNYFTQKVVYG